MCRLNSQLIEPMSLFLVHTEYFFSHTGRNIKECCVTWLASAHKIYCDDDRTIMDDDAMEMMMSG